MMTVEEAMAHLRSLGYPAMTFDYPASSSLRVWGSQEIIPAEVGYDAEEMRVLQHLFVVFSDGKQWIVRDCNWQIDVDEPFGSLAEAVAALVNHFAECRA